MLSENIALKRGKFAPGFLHGGHWWVFPCLAVDQDVGQDCKQVPHIHERMQTFKTFAGATGMALSMACCFLHHWHLCDGRRPVGSCRHGPGLHLNSDMTPAPIGALRQAVATANRERPDHARAART